MIMSKKIKKNNQTTNLYIYDDSSFSNRVFDSLMISAVGRAIHKFRSVSELLKISRDVMKTHKFLYAEKNILQKHFDK